MAEEEDRPGPAEREAAGITAKPEDFVRYVWARDRLREARRDLSEDTAREELLDAYEAGRIEARPGHNYRGPINVKLCRQSSKALEGTWWHAADLERRFPLPVQDAAKPAPHGKPGRKPVFPWEEIAACFGAYCDAEGAGDDPELEIAVIQKIAAALGCGEPDRSTIQPHRDKWLVAYARYAEKMRGK